MGYGRWEQKNHPDAGRPASMEFAANSEDNSDPASKRQKTHNDSMKLFFDFICVPFVCTQTNNKFIKIINNKI